MLPELKTKIPGPRSRELAARLRCVESRNVTMLGEEWPIFWERASGMNVWDVDGNRFLDFTSGFGVTGLGHTASSVRVALEEQAGRMFHAMGDVHPTEGKVVLCEMLVAATFGRWGAGGARVILGNSGSDAVEAALKTAMMATGKAGVMSFYGGYHGLGYGALEAGGLEFFREPFHTQLGRFAVKVPYPICHATGCARDEVGFPLCDDDCLGGVRNLILRGLREHSVGAILVEPMQGRGGEIVPPRGFLPMLREICDAEGVLLIVDEIYTGWNRTGKLFAVEHTGVIPDLICVGKALTSGFPLSACVGKEAVMDAWPESEGEAIHTSTFLGNPLGCAMAVASLREHLVEGIGERVRVAGDYLRSALRRTGAGCFGDVRGIGLLTGIEITDGNGKADSARAGRCVVEGLCEGVLLLAGGREGNVLSLTPPFEVTCEEMDFLVRTLGKICG